MLFKNIGFIILFTWIGVKHLELGPTASRVFMNVSNEKKNLTEAI